MKKLDNPSQEELFELWVDELIKEGYILSYDSDPIPFTLFDEHKKEGVKLLSSTQYKPDGRIIWADKAKDIFFTTEKTPKKYKNIYFLAERYTETTPGIMKKRNSFYSSYLDVKSPPGSGKKNSSDASFIPKRTWMWDKFKIHVNKVYNYPNAFVKNKDKSIKRLKAPRPYLWAQTFTPTRYLWTDKLTKERTINKWTVRTLEEFLS